MLTRRELLVRFGMSPALLPLSGLHPVLSFLLGERLTERKLDRFATIKLPARLKNEILMGSRDARSDRLAFTFGSTYLWASMSGVAHYKQLLVVSIMAPDATDESYTRAASTFSLSRERPRIVHQVTRGAMTLTVTAADYAVVTKKEPSHTFVYRDRSRRLQIMWHAVVKEVSLADGIEAIEAMGASFRLVADPGAQFAEMRERPQREAAERTRRRELVQRMLAAEGLGGLVPGRPVLKDGVYVEWMSDPEPRYQLLVPLGRVRAASAQGGILPRPTPPTAPNGGGRSTLAGSIGWRAFRDGEWEFSNNDNAYLPFDGLARQFADTYDDPAHVFYYYAGTVRVDHEDTDERLTSLRWFLAGVPEVQRLWRTGALVRGATVLPPL